MAARCCRFANLYFDGRSVWVFHKPGLEETGDTCQPDHARPHLLQFLCRILYEYRSFSVLLEILEKGDGMGPKDTTSTSVRTSLRGPSR